VRTSFVLLLIVGSALIAWALYANRPTANSALSGAASVSPQPADGEAIVTDPGKENAKDIREALGAIRSEVALLRAEVAALRREKGEEHAARAESAAADAGLEPFDPAEEEALLIEEEERAMQARLETIEGAIATEPEDAEWSYSAADLIREVLASKEFEGTSLYGLECRSTLCKLEVGHDDRRKRTEFEMRFPMRVASLLPRVTMNLIEDDGGSSRTIVYLAREGHRFPQPEE